MANTKQPDLKESGPSDNQLLDFKKSHVSNHRDFVLCIYIFFLCIEIGTINNWLWPSIGWSIYGNDSGSTRSALAVWFSIHRRCSTIWSWTHTRTSCTCERVGYNSLKYWRQHFDVLVAALLVFSNQLMIYRIFARLKYSKKERKHVS